MTSNVDRRVDRFDAEPGCDGDGPGRGDQLLGSSGVVQRNLEGAGDIDIGDIDGNFAVELAP